MKKAGLWTLNSFQDSVVSFKLGFTLIELLVVVLIIAILTAVAVPQYKRAVLKSRFTTVMPMAKNVADAQEVYYLSNGQYALDKESLDITPVQTEHTAVDLSTLAEENDYNYVVAKRTDYPSARYIVYQQHSPKFAGNIHCEADTSDPEALWLCEKGLQGTEIPGSINTADGDYKTFLLAGDTGGATLPTSINKLKAQLCANISEENCIVDTQNNTITTKECSGQVTSTDGSEYRCTNTTYNANGSEIGHTIRSISAWGNCNPTKSCMVRIKEQDLDDPEGKEYFTNITCNPGGASGEGICLNEVAVWSWSLRDKQNRDWFSVRTYSGWGGNPYTGEIVRATDDSNTYWNHYDGNSYYYSSRTSVSYDGDIATFTTTTRAGNTVINSVSCTLTNADWETGTCKPGTAL